jgi:hypothetical protein
MTGSVTVGCTPRLVPGPVRTVRSSAYTLGGSSASASTNPIATHTNSLRSHGMWRDVHPVRVPILYWYMHGE